MNIETEMYIRGVKQMLNKRLLDNGSLNDIELTLLLQIESFYLLKNINGRIEQEAINKGNFPR